MKHRLKPCGAVRAAEIHCFLCRRFELQTFWRLSFWPRVVLLGVRLGHKIPSSLKTRDDILGRGL